MIGSSTHRFVVGSHTAVSHWKDGPHWSSRVQQSGVRSVTHCPVLGTQVTAVQASEAPQSTGAPGSQAPLPSHCSTPLQRSSSPQAVPRVMGTYSHAPAEQRSSVQGLSSRQSAESAHPKVAASRSGPRSPGPTSASPLDEIAQPLERSAQVNSTRRWIPMVFDDPTGPVGLSNLRYRATSMSKPKRWKLRGTASSSASS
jgi:hypothetical protein